LIWLPVSIGLTREQVRRFQRMYEASVLPRPDRSSG
jgi:hypothetical protein